MTFKIVGRIRKENPDSTDFVLARLENDVRFPIDEQGKEKQIELPPLEILEREGVPKSITEGLTALKRDMLDPSETEDLKTEIARALLGEGCVPPLGENLPPLQPWSGYIENFSPRTTTYAVLDVANQKVVGKVGKETDVSQMETGKTYLVALEE